MPILGCTEHKSPKGGAVVIMIYLVLAIGGLAMIYPFMVMLTGSVSNNFDYNRRAALPRFVWSREDRFMRALGAYFPPTHRASLQQLRSYFPDLPAEWQTWLQIGDDRRGTDRWAHKQLAELQDPARMRHIRTAAHDYGEFLGRWNPRETVLAYDIAQVAPFLRNRYTTLDRLNRAWEMSLDDFANVRADEWSGEPIDQHSYVPIDDTRYADLLAFRQAYRENRFTPLLRGRDCPAGFLRPASLRYTWEAKYAAAGITRDPASLPFPLPLSHFHTFPLSHSLRTAWLEFVRDDFPLRHVRIQVTEARRADFRQFLIGRFKKLDYLSQLLRRPLHSWDDIRLTETVPSGDLAKVWLDFVDIRVPATDRQIRDTLPDLAFQRFALRKHGSLAGVNKAYGLKLACIEQLQVPFRQAMLYSFNNAEAALTLDGASANYRAVTDYLIHRGRAVQNTIILVALAILMALTVNPLAGYALSRFRFSAAQKVIVFCLATMAFPAAVAAIPGFLLLRDLHLLNTFAALVLPSAANGMTIFLLKGFFDSLPRELYEAAAIDGAPEWQVFWRISVPLVKPILAVSVLNAFIAAYNGWEWAIIVCQDKSMWTISVWTYQFFQNMPGQSVVMAAFILNSIPVLLVFLLCQKVILRGIILPQMK